MKVTEYISFQHAQKLSDRNIVSFCLVTWSFQKTHKSEVEKHRRSMWMIVSSLRLFQVPPYIRLHPFFFGWQLARVCVTESTSTDWHRLIRNAGASFSGYYIYRIFQLKSRHLKKSINVIKVKNYIMTYWHK